MTVIRIFFTTATFIFNTAIIMTSTFWK
jgi:hypothetical protein